VKRFLVICIVLGGIAWLVGIVLLVTGVNSNGGYLGLGGIILVIVAGFGAGVEARRSRQP
jgi:hypothetical protein